MHHRPLAMAGLPFYLSNLPRSASPGRSSVLLRRRRGLRHLNGTSPLASLLSGAEQ